MYEEKVKQLIPEFHEKLKESEYENIINKTNLIDKDIKYSMNNVENSAICYILLKKKYKYKYKNLDTFLKEYDYLKKYPDQKKIDIFYNFANIINFIKELKIFKNFGCKRNYLDLATKLGEGWNASCTTGGGQTFFVSMKVRIFENETNIKPVRKKLFKEEDLLGDIFFLTNSRENIFLIDEDNIDDLFPKKEYFVKNDDFFKKIFSRNYIL
uniref:Uncharacterized protein n=1 Tax=viral metagenome TaxID=1070528 RepID=A0A6C0AEQ3_9ZZZZ